MENLKLKDNYIKFIAYKNLNLWDVKRYFANKVESNFDIKKLGLYITEESHRTKLNSFPETEFGILGISNKIGVFDAYTTLGKDINQSYKKMNLNWIAYNPYRINVGSIGIKRVNNKYDYISPAYVVFSCNDELMPEYLFQLFKTNKFSEIINNNTTGSVRQNLTFEILKTLEIPLPDIKTQAELIENLNKKISSANRLEIKANNTEKEIEDYLFDELSISVQENNNKSKGLKFVKYSSINEWGLNKIVNINNSKSKKYQTISLQNRNDLLIDCFRGKSPIYEEDSNFKVLNQKCIKWNEIETEYSKGVNDEWFKKIEDKYLTKVGDILINSTGEGTIGRSSIVTSKTKGLIFDSHIICLRVNNNLINPLFLTFLINSRYGQLQIENLKSAQSTNQTELGVLNILKIQIPFPDLTVQETIIDKISNYKKVIDKLNNKKELDVKKALEEFENSIFKK